MIFGKLLPREGNFFELFNQHAQHTVTAAHAFAELVKHYADPALRERHNRAVDDAEGAADTVTLEVNRLLHQTFITPIDREQIHSLINTMDDVADLLQDAAEAMSLYDIRAMTEHIVRLTDLCVRCVERVKTSIGLLHQVGQAASAEAALKICAEIDQLEGEADKVLHTAMSKLFREEPDVREVIKLKAIYELLETVTDRCDDVGKLIEGVILENS